ncbi:MAG: acyl-CoA dehydrogenase family protein, partial [bacterium]|nr:acyl-CoA dehydrogenase family protein [bacterium]
MEPKVSPFKVPERHRKWVDIAEELSRDAFAPRAAMVDDENRFPFENYDDLRASGLLPLMVPERFGGIGADSFTYATILSKIAQGCASTGLTFNMHSAILFFLRQIATPEQQERYFGEVVTDGAVFSSITSEPGISFRHKGKIRTHIERDG